MRQKLSRMPSEAEISAAPALTAEDVLARDLTANPPQGFPSLTAKQAALIRERAKDPAAPWSAIYARAGLSDRNWKARETPRVRLYLQALARGTAADIDGEGTSAADQRRRILARLAREAATAPDAKDAALAARVWLSEVKSAEEREDLRDLGPDELLARLRGALELLGDHAEGLRPLLSYAESVASVLARFPSGGNSAARGRKRPPIIALPAADPPAAEPLEAGAREGGEGENAGPPKSALKPLRHLH